MHDLSKRYRLFAIAYGFVAGVVVALTFERQPTSTYDVAIHAFIIATNTAHAVWYARQAVIQDRIERLMSAARRESH